MLRKFAATVALAGSLALAAAPAANAGTPDSGRLIDPRHCC